MTLQVTANALTLNTYDSPLAPQQRQPGVTGTVAPVAPPPEDLKSLQSPVQPAVAGAEAEPFSEQRQRLSRDNENSAVASADDAVDTEEQALIRELAARDREVRQHELSHATAGGKFAGAPSYEFERGPDGRLYAVAGEVSIDTSAVPNDPEATLEKAELILRAALAVAEPSPQDRAVAARAIAMAAEARAELARQEAESGELKDARGDAEALREQRRSEALQDQIEDQQKKNEDTAERIQDFSEQLQEINEKFADINQKLIDAGVFKKLFPEGLIFDDII